MRKAVSAFRGSATVSCPPTYRLLSCGIQNVRASGSHDIQRYAIPASNGSTSCQCYDEAEAKCVSWCSNVAVDFTVATSSLVEGNTVVACPTGYKVRTKL